MVDDLIYHCGFITITRKGRDFYIESHRKGFSGDDFAQVLKLHPEISITSFMAVKNAIMFAPRPAQKFGELKERVVVEVTGDELKAYVTVFCSQDEISGAGRSDLIKEIMKKLNENGIVFGVKHEVILNGLKAGEKLLVAEGIPPENGQDSIIRMYELQEVKPEIKEDGNVDHYELNLVNKVSAGAWLGERLDPTPGTPGKSVKGNAILPLPGKTYPLLYDKNSVREVSQNGVTTLYAIREGAVYYEADRIGVSNHLEITHNVDFKTGNIDFDGFVTIKGSIEDSFSVAADKDIEVLGEYGVGSVKEIVSRSGSIYIRGGIAGKNKAVIRTKRDIYTKYISDAEVICEGSVHVGFYCLNSNITAKEIIIDSPRGQIMGGNIKAEIKVVSAIIGSTSEKRTCISVRGFNRNDLKEKLEKLIKDLETVKNSLVRNKQEMSIYSYTKNLNAFQLKEFEKLKEEYFDLRNKIKLMEEEKKALSGYLKTHGEGEVSVLKKIFPNTMLEIKNMVKEINKIIIATSFYYQDGDIKEI